MLNSLLLFAESNVIAGVIFLSIMVALVGFVIWGNMHVAKKREQEQSLKGTATIEGESPDEDGPVGLLVGGLFIMGFSIWMFLAIHKVETGDSESVSLPLILYFFYQFLGKWGTAGLMFLLGCVLLTKSIRKFATQDSP